MAVGTFVPARELSRELYEEMVRPILDARFTGVAHGAALLGRGSEVLGFDDEMSTDHNCEARALVFVPDGVDLRLEVPQTFEGRPALVEATPCAGTSATTWGSMSTSH